MEGYWGGDYSSSDDHDELDNTEFHTTSDSAQKMDRGSHALWDVEGIPASKNYDHTWWAATIHKSKRKMKKELYKTIDDGSIWRFAKILDHNEKQTGKDRFDLKNYGWSNFDPMARIFKNTKDPERRIFFNILLAIDPGLKVYPYSATEYGTEYSDALSEAINEKQYQTLAFLQKIHVLQEPTSNQIFCNIVIENDHDAMEQFLDAGFNPVKALEEVCEKYPIDVTAIKLIMKYEPTGCSYEVFAKLNRLDDQSMFEQLCILQEEYERKGGDPVEGYAVNKFRERQETVKSSNFAGKGPVPNQDNADDAHWHKNGLTSIWHNSAREENGTRLRDLFDFAAQRVLKFQEMPDGRLYLQTDHNFNGFSGAAHIETAAEELKKLGGNTTPNGPDKNPATAHPLP